jgi:Mg-chelatase subunit ChlD
MAPRFRSVSAHFVFSALAASGCSFKAGVHGMDTDAGGVETRPDTSTTPVIVNTDGRPASDGAGRVIGGGPLGDAACAVQTQQAQRVQLDLYVMMDSSGSMDEQTASGPTKWDAVRAALTAFLQDPQSAGLGVGLQYFPLTHPNVATSCTSNAGCGNFGPCQFVQFCNTPPNVACTTNADCPAGVACLHLGACLDPQANAVTCFPAAPGFICNNNVNDPCLALPGTCVGRDICDVAPYATPAVEVATLPGAQAALVASLTQHAPDGLTPTAGALAGAIQHAQALARANPTHRVAVVLATDGLPSECTPTDIAGVAAIAAGGAAATPAISTFVIGVFAPVEATDAQTNLNALAAAGGTGSAFVIDTNQNVTQAFGAALSAIRGMGLSCQYEIPSPSNDGGALDYFSVNVQFTPGTGQAVTIGNVRNKAACSPTLGGWYYDVDPTTGATPRTISICEPSCGQLRADPLGRVDVLLGCKTEIIVP